MGLESRFLSSYRTRNSIGGAGTSVNSGRDNDGHSGSQGADTFIDSEISHTPARGIVSMLKVKKNTSKGIFVKVNWNELGQPIGKESITLAHYVGALARRTFPITITDFRSKELAQSKEAFWDDIMATFKGLDESHKKAIIYRAGNYHRAFRTRLRNLARDANGNYSPEPPVLYRELRTVTEYWNDFVKQALKEEFMATSKKNKERAETMKIAARSQKGEENELWDNARKNVDGVVDDPEALHVFEDVVQIARSLCEDEGTNIGTNDLLARAIRFDYPRRVRGHGRGVTKKSLESAPHVSEFAQLKKKDFILEKKMGKMKGKVSYGPSSGGSSQMDNIEMDDCADPDEDLPDDLDDSRGHGDPDVVLPEGPIECYLYMEPPRRYVGKGILHNGPNETCHDVRLEAGYVRVQFEVAVEEEKYTVLPVPCDEARTVGGAPGYFLPWPKKLVSLEKPEIIEPFMESTSTKKRGRTVKKRGRPRRVEEPNPSPSPQEIILPFRESTTRKKMGRPSRVKEVTIAELAHSSRRNTDCFENSFHQKKRQRVTFSPEPQNYALEHMSDIAAGLSDDSPNYDEVDSMSDTALVKVDEYIVKNENAPLLKSILAKQGNIAMNCILGTPSIRSSLLENVCSLYKKLEKKDLKTVEVSEVKSMLAEVADFEKLELDVKWLRERLEDIAETLEDSEDYSVLLEEIDMNNQDAERKSKELEELEEKARVARGELATIEAKGIKLCERLSSTKVFEKSLVEGLL